MYCYYHKSNSDSLGLHVFKTPSAIKDRRIWAEMKLNESGRKKLDNEKSCQQAQHAKLNSDTTGLERRDIRKPRTPNRGLGREGGGS